MEVIRDLEEEDTKIIDGEDLEKTVVISKTGQSLSRSIVVIWTTLVICDYTAIDSENGEMNKVRETLFFINFKIELLRFAHQIFLKFKLLCHTRVIH